MRGQKHLCTSTNTNTIKSPHKQHVHIRDRGYALTIDMTVNPKKIELVVATRMALMVEEPDDTYTSA
jgi:hypothetical protein